MDRADVVVLGTFVADLAFKAERMPVVGETLLGRGFAMGPGGKGSNQVIAAARAGAKSAMITRIGRDAFGEMARKTWEQDGVTTSHVLVDDTSATGAAFIFVSATNGDNAIIVESGAAANLNVSDIRAAQPLIAGAKVFVTQFEQPIDAAVEGLKLAREHGVTTVLNPAPALPVGDAIYGYCDFVTPNETEAATLTGIDTSIDEGALRAATSLVERGARNVVVTLGAKGALLHGAVGTHFVPAFDISNVVDTTGAGDAFNGGFAVALSEGRPPLEAVRFGAAVAGLSVQKPGTAPSMPRRSEVDAFLRERS
ncbi:ribokinase [Rhizobium sp. BR 314]|uniref:ribokinase n=1 Tax=Rhizobium sp. BR 314 TaxID=3040013 RepID=UPI0039BF6129